MTVEDDIDALYGVPPQEFLARRKELVAAAKKRGDSDAATVIGAARRPTAAAWVVNVLVRSDPTARPRLSELTEALRSAHSAMDGPRIRELTVLQRRLIDELVRAAVPAAGYADATAALRNDVTDTLQAAIADPAVAAKLGRLTKAEKWSGFGEFGELSAVAATPRRKAPPEAASDSMATVGVPESELHAAREREATASAVVAAARVAHSEALVVVAEQKTKLATARRRYEKLLESVDTAEQALNQADAEVGLAERAAHGAAERFDAASSEHALAESELARLAEA